jgi:hypothetical protein
MLVLRTLNVVRIMIWLAAEFPTLCSYIVSELPSVRFHNQSSGDRMWTMLKVIEASASWLRSALNHYSTTWPEGVPDPYGIGTLPQVVGDLVTSINAVKRILEYLDYPAQLA